VVFGSASTNLVPGDTNNTNDVFLRDLLKETTTLISQGLGDVPSNGKSNRSDISADGSVIAFRSIASNLVADDTNNEWDVFVHEVKTGVTTRVSVDSMGNEANGLCNDPMLSADGRFVCFLSFATNLDGNFTLPWPRVYVHDRVTGVTEAIVRDLQGDKDNVSGQDPVISSSGRFVAFDSISSTLVPGDTNQTTDVFVYDRLDGTTVRASVSSTGVEGNNSSVYPTLSANGRFVAFRGAASNLVPGDTNNVSDIIVRDLVLNSTSRASVSTAGIQTEVTCQDPTLSPDGRMVCFESASWVLVPGPSNIYRDIFLHACLTTGPETYCMAQTNSLGCVGAMSFSGVPSASARSGFMVDAAAIRNNTIGTLIYGTGSPAMLPFQGGFLCVAPPVHRTVPLQSGGSSSPTVDCSGVLRLDFNAYASSPHAKGLTPGTTVRAQYWSRDGGSPSGSNLTDAVLFTLRP